MIAGLLKVRSVSLIALITIGTLNFSTALLAGSIADELGMYQADTEEDCENNDQFIMGVCVPVITVLRYDYDELRLGIVELTQPEALPNLIREYGLKHTQVITALEVEIDSFGESIFRLVDGSILEMTSSGYVGYIGYHEDAILYQQAEKWRLCVNGSIHDVDFLKDGGSHYSRSSLSLTLAEIEGRDECD